eukprot:jgi/Mesen1/4431/ME000225S03419
MTALLLELASPYTALVNGFAASLTEGKVAALRADADVARVEESIWLELQTTRTPSRTPIFLNLPDTVWKANGGVESAGEGVVIGVIDSGIDIGSPAFADNASNPYGPPPKGWQGVCKTSSDFPACNAKVIGARFFKAGFEELYGSVIAAGSYGYPIGFFANTASGSGMAPRARLAVYNFVWSAPGSNNVGASTLDAIFAAEKAVTDGVDVLSFAASNGPPYFATALSVAFLNAADAGVLVSCAGGNDGSAAPISNSAPWILTVAASTIDRDYQNIVRLHNGKNYSGLGRTLGTGPRQLPLIYAKDAVIAGGNIPNQNPSLEACPPLAEDAVTAKRKGNVCLQLLGLLVMVVVVVVPGSYPY